MNVGIKIVLTVLAGALLIGGTIFGGYWLLQHYQYRALVENKLHEVTSSDETTHAEMPMTMNDITVFGDNMMVAFTVPSSYVASQSKEGIFAMKDTAAHIRAYVYDFEREPSVFRGPNGEESLHDGIGIYVYPNMNPNDLSDTIFGNASSSEAVLETITRETKVIIKRTIPSLIGPYVLYAFVENDDLVVISRFQYPEDVTFSVIDSLDISEG